jgi:hypothetical protein
MKLTGKLDTKKKLTEVVWIFYHLSNKSYKLNKLAGTKSFNTPKSY